MSLQETIQNITKYSCSNQELPSQIFLFELIIKNKNGKLITLRKIKNQKNAKLISLTDNIIYNDIEKINLSVIDFNNPDNKINIKFKLKKNVKSTFIKNDKINLSICKITQDLTECNYQLLF